MASQDIRIHRHKKKANYLQVDNDIIFSPTLSLKAKGLICFLLAKPLTWKTNLTRLADTLPESKTAIRNALCELEAKGFIRWRKEKNSGGTIMDIYEVPRPNHHLAQDRASRRSPHNT